MDDPKLWVNSLRWDHQKAEQTFDELSTWYDLEDTFRLPNNPLEDKGVQRKLYVIYQERQLPSFLFSFFFLGMCA